MGEPAPKLRILMLHGYTQSGLLFEHKTKVIKKALDKAFPKQVPKGLPAGYPASVEMVFPTGPSLLKPADFPDPDAATKLDSTATRESYGWWVRDFRSNTSTGIEEGIDYVAGILKKEGPFDGVIGFSQGACLTCIIASLLEPGRIDALNNTEGSIKYPQSLLNDDGTPAHPPLKFAVTYAGFRIPDTTLWSAVYDPKIKTPIQNFIGSLDTLIGEKNTAHLIEAFDIPPGEGGKRNITHPGGHFVPGGKMEIAAVVGFIREIVMQDLKKSNPDAEDAS